MQEFLRQMELASAFLFAGLAAYGTWILSLWVVELLEVPAPLDKLVQLQAASVFLISLYLLRAGINAQYTQRVLD